MHNLGANGRLGNQIFQFIFLSNYQVHRDIPISVPKNNSLFELFDIKIPISDKVKLKSKFVEPSLTYNENYLLKPPGTDFSGFFQSERYIPWKRQECKENLAIKGEFKDKAREWIKEKTGDVKGIVGIHIRRGDYTNSDDFYNNPSIDYYVDAARSTNKKKAILFTDGKLTPQELDAFRELDPVFCGEDALTSFAALSQCDSMVISASTFGWWASYLSDSDVSYCPDRWYGQKGPSDKEHLFASHLTRWSGDGAQ